MRPCHGFKGLDDIDWPALYSRKRVETISTAINQLIIKSINLSVYITYTSYSLTKTPRVFLVIFLGSVKRLWSCRGLHSEAIFTKPRQWIKLDYGWGKRVLVSKRQAELEPISLYLGSRSFAACEQCNKYLQQFVFPRERNKILSKARQKNKKAVSIFVSFQLQI